MTPERKRLGTLAVGTLTTGIVMVEGFAGVAEAAEWIMGHAVWTHELGVVALRIRVLVQAQLPEFPCASGEDWRKTKAALLARYGETVELARGAETRAKDPVSTLAEAMR